VPKDYKVKQEQMVQMEQQVQQVLLVLLAKVEIQVKQELLERKDYKAQREQILQQEQLGRLERTADTRGQQVLLEPLVQMAQQGLLVL